MAHPHGLTAGESGHAANGGIVLNSERWQRIQDIFLAALDVKGARRTTLLDDHCTGDPQLRQEVQSLLDAEQESDSVERMADSWLSKMDDLPDPPSLEGQQVGQFLVGPEIGRGGMACVYRAERNDDHFQQTVAIKILYRSHGELAHRFLLERRVLARLEHPNIARLIDGGALPDGSPYLVMEFIDGERIDSWADRPEIGVRQIVELFVQVCDTVQYAHNNLVVHRDLKPGNILVTAEGQPRLLDFGVAKLLGDEDPALTRPFSVVLTPEYASPEQLRGETVTTATDVHALGLVLFRLLSGASPRKIDGWSDAQIRERITSADEALPSQLAEDPQRSRRLRGDLDNIVGRATHPEPSRRYRTPEALKDDLLRWLGGQPVQARPASRRYRAAKFVRRHRSGVFAAALAVVLLLVGSGSVLWQARIAARERDTARQAAAQSAEVTRFLVQLFQSADPVLAGGETVTVRQILDEGREGLRGRLRNEPRARVAVLQAMGDAYLNLGLIGVADTLLNEAHELTRTIGADSLDLAATLGSLARLDEAAGRLEPAAARFRQVLGIRRRHLPAHDPLIATTLNNLGAVYMGLARNDSALTYLEQARTLRLSDQDRPARRAEVESNLATVYTRLARYDEADRLFAQVDSLLAAAGLARSSQRATALGGWAVLRYRRGDLEGARERVESAGQTWRALVGDDHPEVATAEHNLAAILEKLQRDEEAELHYREALRIKRLALGEEHPSTARSLNNLAILLQRGGGFEEAERLFRESMVMRERTLPDGHPALARGWYNLARLLHETDRRSEAEELYRRALRMQDEALGSENSNTIATAASLAGLLDQEGRTVERDSVVQRYDLERSEPVSD